MRTFRLVPRTPALSAQPANNLVRIHDESGSIVIDRALYVCTFPPNNRSTALSPVSRDAPVHDAFELPNTSDTPDQLSVAVHK